MKRSGLFLALFIVAFSALQTQAQVGYNMYRFSLAKWDQDVYYNGASAGILPGKFYGIDTYGNYLLGGEVANNFILGFYFEAALGMSYDPDKKDFGDAIGLHLNASPGLGMLFTSNKFALGLKSYLLLDFDRISMNGIMLKPTLQFGKLFGEVGFSSPLGTSKDYEMKQMEVGLYYMAGKNYGFGLKYDARSAKNPSQAQDRANLNQIHLCFFID